MFDARFCLSSHFWIKFLPQLEYTLPKLYLNTPSAINLGSRCSSEGTLPCSVQGSNKFSIRTTDQERILTFHFVFYIL